MNATAPAAEERLARYMGARYGLRSETIDRYRDAIRDCADIRLLHRTVTQIARDHGHQPEAFRRILKRHFMEMLQERERIRHQTGISKQPPRGLAEATRRKYEPALRLLRRRDITVREAAEQTDVDNTSLQQHILFYHKDLAQKRFLRRTQALGKPRQQGRITANGSIARPRGTTQEYYAEAVAMLAAHPELTVREVACRTGVNASNLSCYTCRWHRDIVRQRQEWRRHQTALRQQESRGPNRFERTARKYAAALQLVEQGLSFAEAAAQTNVNRDRLGRWTRQHRPELFEREREGRVVTMPDGTRILRSSFVRYQEAAREYCQTEEPLKHIAQRHGFSPNAFYSYLKMVHPDAVTKRRESARNHRHTP